MVQRLSLLSDTGKILLVGGEEMLCLISDTGKVTLTGD